MGRENKGRGVKGSQERVKIRIHETYKDIEIQI